MMDNMLYSDEYDQLLATILQLLNPGWPKNCGNLSSEA